MLQVGLTGGIGSGKSTVARCLVGLGAVLIDADQLAREVVAPGSPGLAEIVRVFGPKVLADGALDRPAVAALVFGDPAARTRLNDIVHPRIRVRADELVAAAAPDAVVVQDLPLLVERAMASGFPLVVVVHADLDTRLDRLVRQRGMVEADARARIAAQADDAARRAVADVWLDNSGAAATTAAAVTALWHERLVPFERTLRSGRPPVLPSEPVPPDPDWPAAGRRLAARVAAAAGARGRGVTHVGPTAVAGQAAPDVVELLLAVAEPADAGAVGHALSRVGFLPGAGRGLYLSADPGRPARLAVHPVGATEARASCRRPGDRGDLP